MKKWFIQEYSKLIGFIKKYNVKLFLIFLVAISIFAVFDAVLSEKLELMLYDARVKRNMKQASSDIVIVNIDNNTLNYIGKKEDIRFPFPRGIYGKVFKTISEGKPKAIVVDIRFENRSKEWDTYNEYSDKAFYNYIKKIPNLYFVHALNTSKEKSYQQKEKILASLSKDDKNSQITINDYFLWCKEKNKPSYKQIKSFFKNKIIIDNTVENNKTQNALNYLDMKKHIKYIYDTAKAFGIVNAYPDQIDKVLRSIRPVYKYYDGYLFHMSLEVASSLLGDNGKVIFNKDSLVLGNKEIPLLNGKEILLNWRKRVENPPYPFKVPDMLTYPSIRFENVYDNKAVNLSPDVFKDKIVLIGITTDQVNDYFKTPHRAYIFGVEVIATAIDNLMNDDIFIKRASNFVNYLVCFLLSFVIVVIYLLNSFTRYYYRNMMYCMAALCAYFVINKYLFDVYGLWINFINPVAAAIICLVSLIALNILIESDKRLIVESTFSKYVSPQVFRQLLANYENIDLSTYRSDITILFSDIRGFTPFTESMEPEEVSRYLNEYFTEMVEVVLKHNGTVDKFMGDAIMAFFGAPVKSEDHAYEACKTAFEMMNSLDKLNEKWFTERGMLLKIGVGINTGQALVGNFGSPKLMDYTVIGDSVNVASRLESLNKELKTSILISEQTYELVKDRVQVIHMGPCELKGKTEKIEVYELVDIDLRNNT